MANSADPDQLASSEADLHCLQRQGISGFSRTRVKIQWEMTSLHEKKEEVIVWIACLPTWCIYTCIYSTVIWLVQGKFILHNNFPITGWTKLDYFLFIQSTILPWNTTLENLSSAFGYLPLLWLCSTSLIWLVPNSFVSSE